MLSLENKVHNIDAYAGLPQLSAEVIYCIITSPPYWGLRDYRVTPTHWPAVIFSMLGRDFEIEAMECCLGMESTPEAYIGHMVLIFREAWRVLRKDGTLWVNIADSYAAAAKNRTVDQQTKNSTLDGGKKTQIAASVQPNKVVGKLKPKDMVGIPWMLAFALRDEGWYLRQDIIWSKPNAQPESVKDRCTKSHEYFFLLTKSRKYYFDSTSIKIPAKTFDNRNRDRNADKLNNTPGRAPMRGLKRNNYEKANKRSVWTINTQPYHGAHYATFPPRLIVDPIKAGCPRGGVVLDLFAGSGTTGEVAVKLERNFVGFELNLQDAIQAQERINKSIGLFNQ